MAKANRWKVIFFVAGILILGYMIYSIGINEIWDNIKKTGWWFVPIIGVWLVVYSLNALAWGSIIRDKNVQGQKYPSFLQILKVTISGYAINYVTPVVALGGEPYRVLEMQEKLGTRKATSGVLSYSLMHMLSHIVFWMCSIILILFLLRPSLGIVIGCVVTFFVFAFVLYFIFKGYKNGLVEKTFALLAKIPFIKKPVRRYSEKHLESFNEIDNNIINLYTNRKSTFFLALGLEVLARTVSCFEIFFIAKAVGIDISLLDSIVLYAGSTLFSNIMFFSPMQLGTREGGLALTLKIMGQTASFGIYMGLVMRIRELFWIAIGMLLMRIRTFSKKKTMDKRQIKGIIFDYGGTLDTNGTHWFEIFCDAYRTAEIAVDKEVLREAYIFGEREMECNSSEIKPDDTFLDNLERKIGYQLDYLIENELADESIREQKGFIVRWCYHLASKNVTEATDVLEKLKEKYAIVLVSNFYGNLKSVLKDYKIEQYFDNVIESSIVGIRKPDPDIFKKGLEALKLEANEVAVIGDSHKNDMEPAQTLGCTTIWLKGLGWNKEGDTNKNADFIIKDLSEVLNIVKM